MPLHAIDHYNLRAPEDLLNHIREFYCTVLGFDGGERPGFTHAGNWLYADGYPLLHLSEAGADEHIEANVPGTFNHIAFRCTDLDGTVEHLEKLGVDYRRRQVPGRDIVQLFLHDPAGNGIELAFSKEDQAPVSDATDK